MNDTHIEYNRIQKNLDKWAGKLKSLRETCPHTAATVEYGSNTGNYDPMNNCYWKHLRVRIVVKFGGKTLSSDNIYEIGIDPNPKPGTYTIIVENIMTFMDIHATFNGESWEDISQWKGNKIYWIGR